MPPSSHETKCSLMGYAALHGVKLRKMASVTADGRRTLLYPWSWMEVLKVCTSAVPNVYLNSTRGAVGNIPSPLFVTCVNSNCWYLLRLSVLVDGWMDTKDGDLLFALRMEVNTTDLPFSHVHADVVEALEASTCYIALPMVRHKKMLLPPHEDMFL